MYLIVEFWLFHSIFGKASLKFCILDEKQYETAINTL